MTETPTVPPRRRVRTERLEVTVNPEEQKLDHVAERIRLQKETFVRELKSRLGLMMMTCEAMNISYETVRGWAKTDPDFLAQISGVQEYTLDVVEQRFLKKIVDEGDTTAMIFYLKTKGKGRGFSTRVELTGANGGPIESESTIKVSEIQKELPADVLDAIIMSSTANIVQPVANPHLTQPVLEAVVKEVSSPNGYEMDEELDDEEEEIE